MLTCAIFAAAGLAVLVVLRAAQQPAASPVRVSRRTIDHVAHQSGTRGAANDSWGSNGHGYRNC